MPEAYRNPRRQRRQQQYEMEVAVPAYGMQDPGPAVAAPAAQDVPLPPSLIAGPVVDVIARPIGNGATGFVLLLLMMAAGLIVWFVLTPGGGVWRYVFPAIVLVLVNLMFWSMHSVSFDFDRDLKVLRHSRKFKSCRKTQVIVVPFADFGDLEFVTNNSEKSGTSTKLLLDYRRADGEKLLLLGNVQRSGFTQDEVRLQWSTYLASLAPVGGSARAPEAADAPAAADAGAAYAHPTREEV
jgi:hypothetical protein